MPARWHRRLWGSLHEPPIVTALMVAVYGLCVVCGAYSMTLVTPFRWASWAACVILIAGGTLAIPAAWRGAWWLEGPAAGFATLGFVILSVLDVIARVGDGSRRFPGLLPILMALVALFFLIRIIRIWPHLYAPGSGRDPVVQAQARAARVVAESEQHIDSRNCE